MSEIRKKWTIQEDNDLLSMYLKLEHFDIIANKLNVSKKSAQKRIYRLLKSPARKMTEDNIKYIIDNFEIKTYKELANELKVSDQTIFNTLSRLGFKKLRSPHLSREYADKVIDLLKNGNRVVDIEQILGLTKAKVTQICINYNIDTKVYYTEEMTVRHKIKEDAGLTSVLTSYKCNARRSNILFTLTTDEFKQLITSSCFIVVKNQII